MRKILNFTECEHSGDLDKYASDIKSSGGSVISSEIDDGAEVGIVLIEVTDHQLFKEKFQTTESYDFCETYYF